MNISRDAGILRLLSVLLLTFGAGLMLWGSWLIYLSLLATNQNGANSMSSLMDVAVVVGGWVLAFGGYTLAEKARPTCSRCGLLGKRGARSCDYCTEPLPH